MLDSYLHLLLCSTGAVARVQGNMAADMHSAEMTNLSCLLKVTTKQMVSYMEQSVILARKDIDR